MTKAQDPTKYISLGVHPNDVATFTVEEIEALDKRLTLSPADYRKQLADAFDKAISNSSEIEPV